MASRNPADLHSALRAVGDLAIQLYRERHPAARQPIYSTTHRPGVEQSALYAQPHDGRDNDGDGLIDESDECVTHARAGQSAHNKVPSCAFDVSFPIPGTRLCDWNPKLFEDFAACVQEAARRLGTPVTSGISWPRRKKDRPHHELTGWQHLN